MKNTVHIWDSDLVPTSKDCQIILWRSYIENQHEKSVSIPRLVDNNYNVLKARYLAWIFDLGEGVSRGKRVVDHLELRPGLSFWWMTLISEKCNYSASPQITDAIRLFAFDLWTCGNNVDTIKLTSDNKALVECVEYWCRERRIPFCWNFTTAKKPASTITRKIYEGLPNTLRALVQFARRLWTCWPLRGTGLLSWGRSNGKITFFSYLLDLDETGISQGEFKSRFWTELPGKLDQNDCKTNWLHIYCGDPSRSSARQIKAKLENFNNSNGGAQVHTLLETFLSWPVALKTLIDWFGLLNFAKSLEPIVSRVDSEGIYLWPLFKAEWHSSISGVSSISTMLNFNLFEKAVGILPKQWVGIYLYEQQVWELALIHCWRHEQHGTLVGAQHSTILDWNLRNFHDPRSYERLDSNDLPMPDILAVNGPIAMDSIIKSGYPEGRLFEVEALRYLYLDNLIKENEFSQFKKTAVLRLLVLGDYLEANTKSQMDLLVRTLVSFPVDILITVKPHPSLMIDPSDYPEIDITVTTEPLKNLLGDCDLAYSSPVTSASVDAYCCGIPVITMLDPNALNLSPLRKCDGVFFVSTPSELSQAIGSVLLGEDCSYIKKNFFRLDSGLPRWRELLLEGAAPQQ